MNKGVCLFSSDVLLFVGEGKKEFVQRFMAGECGRQLIYMMARGNLAVNSVLGEPEGIFEIAVN
jgi:hypothetical protein